MYYNGSLARIQRGGQGNALGQTLLWATFKVLLDKAYGAGEETSGGGFRWKCQDERVNIWLAKLEDENDVAFVFFDLRPLADEMIEYAKK
jgi:hypothetical protein